MEVLQMTNYWETFKKQASHDYMKTNHEMVFAKEFGSEEEVLNIKPILKERERILKQICEIDEAETVEMLLGIPKQRI